MQNSIWKLTALAGVVGLGFLVVLQVQFGLSRPADELETSTPEHKPAGGTAEKSKTLPLAGQTEPAFKSEVGNTGPTENFKPVSQALLVSVNSSKSETSPLFVQNEEPAITGGGSGTNPQAASSPFAKVEGDGPPVTAEKPNRTVEGNDSFPGKENEAGKAAATLFGKTENPAVNVSNQKDVTNFTSEKTDSPSGESKTAGQQGDETQPDNGSGFGSPSPNGFATEKKTETQPLTETPPSLFQKEENPDKQPTQSESSFGASPFEKNEPQKETTTPPVKTATKEPFSAPGVSPEKKTAAKVSPFGSIEKQPATTEEKVEEKSPPSVLLFGPTDSKNNSTSTPGKSGVPEKEERKAESIGPFLPFPAGEETAKPKIDPKLDASAPKQLAPMPKAERLLPETEKPVFGDGTVGKNSPRGPQRTLLTIEKSAPKNAVLKKPFVYDITIKNVGTSPAFEVVVKDQVPKGARLTGTLPQAFLKGKTLIWKLGKLQPGKEKKISVRIIPITAGHVGSVATVHFVSEAAAATLITAPKLSFDIIGPSWAKIGESLAYKFVISNTGTATAKEVWLRDIIPDGLKHAAGKDIEYKVGELLPGKSETIVLKLLAVKVGKATNRGIVTSKGGKRLASESVVEIVSSRLVISRTGPKQRVIGRTAVYTNLVTNDSGREVKGAKLTEVIPVGMEFVEANSEGQYDPVRRMVAWEIGPLKSKQSRSFQLKLLPRTAGDQQSLVKAHVPQGDIVRVNSKTVVQGYPVMGVDVHSVGRPVKIGEQLTLQVVAKNRGTRTSNDVRIQLQLPENLDLVQVRGGARYIQKNREVTFSPIITIKPGSKVTYDIVVKARKAGDVRVGVQVQSREMKKPLNGEEAILIIPRF